MAIAVDNTSNATDSNATSISAQHICTGTDTNGILIVAVQVTDSSSADATIASVTHNGEACTHLRKADRGAVTGLYTEIWYRVNPTTGGTPNIVVTAGGKCTDLSFGAISLTGVNSDINNTYYFDGSDAAASDPDGAWDNETNADDGDIGTIAEETAGGGSLITNYVDIEGTNAPASGGTIEDVLVRAHNGVAWGDYEFLAAPAGGWTWAKLQALEVRFFYLSAINACRAYIFADGSDKTSTMNSLNATRPIVTTSDDENAISRIELLVFANIISENATGNNTPPTLDITTEGSNSYVVDSLASGESDGTKITEAHSKIHKTDVGGDTHASQYVDAGGAGVQTMNYSDDDADTFWAMSAVAVKEAVTAVLKDPILNQGIIPFPR